MIPQNQRRFFQPLEQTDFIRLEQAAYLKGLLKAFKGKRGLEDWASQCHTLRDQMITLAQRRILPQTRSYPFNLLSIELAQQKTGAGTTFLRWRSLDRSQMGVALWEELMDSSSHVTPRALLDDLLAIEQQRIVLNMQISLLHTLGRQARECASKMAQAENVYLRQIAARSHQPLP
ncbi:Integrase regulator R [plant metagenome]|uniref:Integrase regulator R n=1 Tax=plant metagenome TaxID=1297885 RepID=A0A484PEY0_9ZZZZ